jgi:hypothetical protein
MRIISNIKELKKWMMDSKKKTKKGSNTFIVLCIPVLSAQEIIIKD